MAARKDHRCDWRDRAEALQAELKVLEKNSVIKVCTKLPGWFTVPTPVGGYNPDWAVLVEEDGGERLYFVVETKIPAGFGTADAYAGRLTTTALARRPKADFRQQSQISDVLRATCGNLVQDQLLTSEERHTHRAEHPYLSPRPGVAPADTVDAREDIDPEGLAAKKYQRLR